MACFKLIPESHSVTLKRTKGNCGQTPGQDLNLELPNALLPPCSDQPRLIFPSYARYISLKSIDHYGVDFTLINEGNDSHSVSTNIKTAVAFQKQKLNYSLLRKHSKIKKTLKRPAQARLTHGTASSSFDPRTMKSWRV